MKRHDRIRPLASISVSLLIVGLVVAAEPDRTELLRTNMAIFERLPTERQQQLRRLDQQLHDQPPIVQARLQNVMEDYVRWLKRLPEEQQKQVLATPPEQRLTLIRQIRDQQFIDSLPMALKQRLEKEPGLLAEFRQNEEIWRDDWLLVKRNWDEIKANRFALPFHDEAFRAELEAYLANLGPHLSNEERDLLRKAKNSNDEGNVFRYARRLLELSDRHPLLPGPQDGPKTWDALPLDIREFLERNQIVSPKQPNFEGWGRWPDYAAHVTKVVREKKLKLPKEFGPTLATSYAQPDFRLFVGKIEKLMDKDKDKDKLADRMLWSQTKDHWPEFPKLMLDMSKKYGVPIPGYTLPGSAAGWEKVRVKKNVGK